MERLFHLFSRLLRDDDFRRFQCDVSDSAYEQLSRSYLANEDEVALVGRLVKATNGKPPLSDVASLLGGSWHE